MFGAVTRAAQLTAPLSSTSKNRDLPASLIAGTVLPYVQGLAPSNMLTCVASVANQPVDVALLLSLPSAPTAITAGPGGGWVDGSPWPTSLSQLGQTPTTVSLVQASNVLVVNATSAPVAGVSSVAWISYSTWQLYTAIVTAVSGTSGAYTITLSAPFPGVQAGDPIFPQAVNQQNYLAAALQAFANLGPGEWSSNATVLTRAFRHPTPGAAQQFPYGLDANFLRTMENAGAEVLTAQWLYRSSTPVNGLYNPTVPGTPTVNVTTGLLTSAPPNIFVPRRIAWYAS
jgi:hypothetical protein